MSSSLRRAALPRLFLVTALLGLAACEDTESPVAPGEDPIVAAGEPAQAAAVEGAETAALAGWQRILFTSARSGGYDLYRTDPSGSNTVRFTRYDDYEIESAWSYNNGRVAMMRPRRDAAGKYHSDVFLVNGDGTNGQWARPTPLSYDLRYPSWHPDGSRILVTIMQQGKPYVGRMTVSTGQVSFVTSGGVGIQGGQAAYHPNGTKIVYVGPTGQTVDQINLDGSGHKVLYSGTTYVGGPKISPDGTKLVFQKVFGSNIDLCLVNLVDGTKLRLTINKSSNFSPSWSPDGSRIAFASDRTGVSQIYTMDAKGTNLSRLTYTATQEKDPAWSH